MLLTKQVYTQKLQKFQQKYHIFESMKEIVLPNKKILVAISGGVDSVLLSILIYHYFLINQIPLSQLHFIHFNHATRAANKTDEEFIKQFLSGQNLSLFTRDSGKYTEESLRKWRYQKLEKYAGENNIDYVCLGHNLDDRLESTLLNMMRGCDLNGFISMQKISNHPLLSQKIYRPLITLPKKEILDFITANNISYVQDPTNFDPEVSMRNYIRKELIPKLIYNQESKKNKFYDSLNNIYNAVTLVEQKNIGLIPLVPHMLRNAEYYYKLDCAKSELNNTSVFNLFKKLHISNNISQQTISEFSNFLTNSNKGYKYLNNVYFFISHGSIYIIKAKENFRKRNLDKKIHINKLGVYQFDNISCKIVQKSSLNAEIVYAEGTMTYKSKNRNKYCINKKIPIFWRQYIPVLMKDKKIQTVFIPKNMW